MVPDQAAREAARAKAEAEGRDTYRFAQWDIKAGLTLSLTLSLSLSLSLTLALTLTLTLARSPTSSSIAPTSRAPTCSLHCSRAA